MFSFHPRTGRALGLVTAGALLSTLPLLSGCGHDATPASSPAVGAPTAAKADAPKSDAMKKAEAAAAHVDSTAKSAAEAAKADAAKSDPAKPAAMPNAEQAGAAAKQAPVEGAKPAEDAAKAAAGGKAAQNALTEQNKVNAAKADAAHGPGDGHDHSQDAAAAQKPPFDPNNPESVDPNSKAKLTYEFGSDTQNFGKVLQGDVLNHIFALASSGEEDLIIKQAKPTCGCTVAQITVQQADGTMAPYAFGNPIPVGRKVELKATLHTVNKRGHAGSRINIFSNDPRGQTQLGLEAEVEPFFNINPVVINFNTLSAKDTAADKASISTAHGEKVKLNAFLDNVPQGLKVELKPVDADAEMKASRWDLLVTAGPGLVEGNLAYMVPLKSDMSIPGGEKLPNGMLPTYESSITVMGRVTGMLEYVPQFVSLGLIRPGQAQSRSIRLTSHDTEFKLSEPKVSVQGRDSAEWEFAKYFTTQIRPVPNENAVDVEVTLTGMPESLNGSFSGSLVIDTGYPGKTEIKLPITGVCRGGAVTPPSSTTPLPPQAPASTPPK